MMPTHTLISNNLVMSVAGFMTTEIDQFPQTLRTEHSFVALLNRGPHISLKNKLKFQLLDLDLKFTVIQNGLT